MGDHPNVQRMRDGYNAFATGDMPGVMDFFADDVVWHVPGRNPLSGDYKGKEEVMGFFAKLMEKTQGSLKQEIHDIVANDEHGVALVHATAEAGGKRLDQNAAHVMHINSEGKVTEFWNFPADGYASDEFLS